MKINRELNIKPKILKILIFILGVIATLTITWVWNIFLPTDPVIVKELTDTVSVIHKYDFGKQDTLDSDILRKYQNLKLLNDYEEEINKRIKNIEIKTKTLLKPNLIVLNRNFSFKGWSDGSSSLYFSLKCPKSNNSEFLDYSPNFLNENIILEVAYFRVMIYRINTENSRGVILDEYYEVNGNSNLLRIVNDFRKGKYKINIGIIFKKDMNKDFPTFYKKSCYYTIE